ncbi:hypothetical protein FRC12_002488 [Ceratobasidium sp. 428]|nr:hypothetical protein FRC12_002488 [Ceratobasidium sp. 428]
MVSALTLTWRTSHATSHKPDLSTPQPWILIHKSAVSTYECTSDEIGPRTATHPEGSIIHSASCVVSNRPVDGSLEELGRELLQRAGLEECGTAFVMSDGSSTRYYLANHSAKVITWAGSDAPSSVSTADPQRAQNILHEEYWVHVENFPAPVSASAKDLSELKAVLASLAVDASTSDGSTSPFSAAQIQEFLLMLNTFSDTIGVFQTYTIARLWSMIWHARVVNNFGTTGACLDRFTTLAEKPPAFTGVYAGYAKLCLGAGAEAHLMRCSRAWAGRIAYVSEWRSFKAKNEREWTQAMYLACVLMIASLIIRSQSAIRFIPTAALVLGLVSAAAGYHLVNESQNLGDQAADASVHFQHWETAQHGVQVLALRNAIPQALLTWGSLIFALSILL